VAKPLNYVLDGRALSFELGSKVDKRALYGFAKRVAEKDGRELERGLLLADGRLLPRSAVASVRADPSGSPLGEVQAFEGATPAVQRPSSFDQVAPLKAINMLKLAEFAVRDVYPLTGEGLEPGLYQTEFNYRAGYQTNDALILKQAERCFLLVGVFKQSTPLSLMSTYEFFDEDDTDAGDELDFSMV
jgi:hypothetical protein